MGMSPARLWTRRRGCWRNALARALPTPHRTLYKRQPACWTGSQDSVGKPPAPLFVLMEIHSSNLQVFPFSEPCTTTLGGSGYGLSFRVFYSDRPALLIIVYFKYFKI